MFELTIYDTPIEPDRWESAHTTARRRAEVAAKRERARKAAGYLGPWCPNCGKRGTRCEGRALKGCKARALKRAVRGFDRQGFFGHTLPNPPEAWRIARGYGRALRYYGGREDWRSIRQHYAYELAMGRADVNETETAAA